MIIMGPGSYAGIVVGIIICAIFAVIAIKVSKKEKVSTDAILASLSDEQKEEIKNQGYTEADGRNMYKSQGFIHSIKEDGDKSVIGLIFYMPEHGEYYTRNVKMAKAEADAKGYTAQSFVPVLMKYDKDMHYYDFKKII